MLIEAVICRSALRNALLLLVTLLTACTTPTPEITPTDFPATATLIPATAALPSATPTPAPRRGIDYPVRIMPLGDSITEGACDAPENCNLWLGIRRPVDGLGLDACGWALNTINPNGFGYRTFLHDKLIARRYLINYVGSVSVVDGFAHEGHSGWTIRDIDYCIQNANWLQEHQPDIILLHIGTNDGNQSRSHNQMSADLTMLLEHIYEILPETTEVIVAQLIPTANYLANLDLNEKITLYNYKIPEIVRELRASGKHVSYVNMSGVIHSNADFDRWGFHPNKAASQRMAEIWLGRIIEILGQP